MADLYDQETSAAEPAVDEATEQQPGRIQRMRERAAKVQRVSRQGIALIAEMDDRLQQVGRRKQPAKFDTVKLERPQSREPEVTEPQMAEPSAVEHVQGPSATQTQADTRGVRISYDERGRPVLSRIDDAAEAAAQEMPTVEVERDLSH